jgi:hypothetical protein
MLSAPQAAEKCPDASPSSRSLCSNRSPFPPKPPTIQDIMELSRTLPRALPSRLARPALHPHHAPSPAALACSPMAIWSRRQFTSDTKSLFPGPQSLNLGGGGSSGGQTSYFQKSQSLPANTIIRFVPQQTAWIVERMGKFNRILSPGLAILIPIIDVGSLIDCEGGGCVLMAE